MIIIIEMFVRQANNNDNNNRNVRTAGGDCAAARLQWIDRVCHRPIDVVVPLLLPIGCPCGCHSAVSSWDVAADRPCRCGCGGRQVCEGRTRDDPLALAAGVGAAQLRRCRATLHKPWAASPCTSLQGKSLLCIFGFMLRGRVCLCRMWQLVAMVNWHGDE